MDKTYRFKLEPLGYAIQVSLLQDMAPLEGYVREVRGDQVILVSAARDALLHPTEHFAQLVLDDYAFGPTIAARVVKV